MRYIIGRPLGVLASELYELGLIALGVSRTYTMYEGTDIGQPRSGHSGAQELGTLFG